MSLANVRLLAVVLLDEVLSVQCFPASTGQIATAHILRAYWGRNAVVMVKNSLADHSIAALTLRQIWGSVLVGVRF